MRVESFGAAFPGVGEVVDGAAGAGVGLSPELDEGAGWVAGGAEGPEGIVPAAEEVGHAREPADFREDVLQKLALGEARMIAEVDDLLI